jgi:hypothetical protein
MSAQGFEPGSFMNERERSTNWTVNHVLKFKPSGTTQTIKKLVVLTFQCLCSHLKLLKNAINNVCGSP